MTRDEKLKAFGELLTKVPGIKKASVYADELANTVLLKFDHPHAGRPFRILGSAEVKGFWHLRSAVPIGWNAEESRMDYTITDLCIHESQFERIQ